MFTSIILEDSTMVLTAVATGHPTKVVQDFHDICSTIYRDHGAWRITLIHGVCLPEMTHDSEMLWRLRAERKVDHLLKAGSTDGAIKSLRDTFSKI